MDRQKEQLERKKANDRQIEIKREREKEELERQMQMERQNQIEREMEIQRQTEKIERQKEIEKRRQIERQKEIERQMEMEIERQKQIEMQMEIQRQAEEMERQKEFDRQVEMERKKEVEKGSQKLDAEKLDKMPEPKQETVVLHPGSEDDGTVKEEQNDQDWIKVKQPSKESQEKAKQMAKTAANIRRSITPLKKPTSAKFSPFEVQDSRSFSVSGMWTNVQLGFVKERAELWRRADNGMIPTPRGSIKSKRKSRVIDPNEWIEPKKKSPPLRNELHKSVSIGSFQSSRLSSDNGEVEEEHKVVSQAVAAVQNRPDGGRKSADIFASARKEARDKELLEQQESRQQQCQPKEELKVKEEEATADSENVIAEEQQVKLEDHCQVGDDEMKKEEEQSRLTEEKRVSDEKLKLVEQNILKDQQILQQERLIYQEQQKVKKEIVEIQQKVEQRRQQKAKSSKMSTQSEEKSIKKSPDFVESRQIEKEVVKTATKSKIESTPAPEVPWRTSSKLVVKEKLQQTQQASPTLNLVNVMVSSGAPPRPKPPQQETFNGDWKANPGEIERKMKDQEEQERKFKEKLKIEQRYKETFVADSDTSSSYSYGPPKRNTKLPPALRPTVVEVRKREELKKVQEPPRPIYTQTASQMEEEYDSSEIDRIRAEELKELHRLREMERRKQAIEEEIAKEKQHLIDLQLLELDSIERARHSALGKPKAVTQYETMVAQKMGQSPVPPPVPKLPDPPYEANTKDREIQRQKELRKLQRFKTNEEESKKDIEELKRKQMEELLTKTKRIQPTDEDFSVDSTLQDLESTTNQLKEFAESHCSESLKEDSRPSSRPSSIHKVSLGAQPPATEEEIKNAAGAVREVAHALLKALTPTPDQKADDQEQISEGIVKNVKNALQKLEEIPPSPRGSKRLTESPSKRIKPEQKRSDDEEDTEGYSEGGEEFSCGIDLPTTQDCSGNVTPIPTTGELEDISMEESKATNPDEAVKGVNVVSNVRPVTPLKSLLKKHEDHDPPAAPEAADYDDLDCEHDDEGRYSPKKVTFSEIDQIKLMSMESLVSTATSDTSTCEGSSNAISGPVMSTRAHPGYYNAPKRNQTAYQRGECKKDFSKQP